MLLGLRTWWLAAIATPFLRLYVTRRQPGDRLRAAGWPWRLAAIWLSVRRIGRLPPRRLLAGPGTRVGSGWAQVSGRSSRQSARSPPRRLRNLQSSNPDP